MSQSESCWMLWAELFRSDSFFWKADSEKPDMMNSNRYPKIPSKVDD